MEDGITLIQNENGQFEEYKPYAEIVCRTKEEFERLQNIVERYKGWRDINEELPDPGKYVLVSFENEGVTLPDIATYEVDEHGNGAFYPSDCEATYASVGVFVNAWMPLPKLYKREEVQNGHQE